MRQLPSRFQLKYRMDHAAALILAAAYSTTSISAPPVIGPLAGVLLLSLNARLSARKVLAASPALTLRDSV